MNICECPELNPLQRDGTSQAQRLLPMLDPAYILSDERSLEDILVFAKEYAAFLRFYDTDENNKNKKEDWVNFIEADITTLISIISVTDLSQLRNDYNANYKALQKTTSKANFKTFAEYVIGLVLLIDKWYRSATDELSLKKDLKIMIKSALSSSYESLIRNIKNTESVWSDSLGIDYPDINLIWNAAPDSITADISSLTGTTKAKILAISSGVNSVFESFYDILKKLVNKSRDYLQESLEKYPNHQPHIALFIAFILLFKHAQDNLNGITKKHLDYYYKEVLQLKEKDAVPDEVHLIFELAKNTSKYKLKKNTSLKAGKDDAGKNLFYATEKDVVLNPAYVSSLRTIFIEKDFDGEKYQIKNIYSASAANSADGKGKAFDAEGTPWNAMGKSQWDNVSQKYLPEENRTMELAEIGFAVSSPQLFLSEGRRIITLTIGLKGNDYNLSELKKNITVDGLSCSLSGEKEWIDIESSEVNIDFKNGSIVLKITVNAELPAVAKYNEAKLGYKFSTEYPVLLILLNEKKTPYEYLKNLQIDSMSIKAEVFGVKEIILQNDSSVINPEKPFYPFGTLPVAGSSFYIGSGEIFSKKIDTLTVKITWHGLPTDDFSDYYKAYEIFDTNGSSTFKIENGSFKVKIQKLLNNKWEDVKNIIEDENSNNKSDEPRLFKSDDKSKLAAGKELQTPVLYDKRDNSISDFTEYSSKVNRGFIKLSLLEPDFQHKRYAGLLTYNVVNKKPSAGSISVPNEPYTPQIKEITLDYTSAQTFESGSDKFYHIVPFGNYEALPAATDNPDDKALNTQYLLPQFSVNDTGQEGMLFIGLSKFTSGSIISLLIKAAEGSGDASFEYPEDINWCYLSDNEWIKLDKANILSDATNDLRTSGIIELEIPKSATDDDTRMPADYHWIRASVDKNSQAINKLIDIKAQAVLAVFTDRKNDPGHLEEPLSAKSISKLEFGISEIKSVTQPYSSFGGKTKELSGDFYTRISERLRHKNRSINIFDYERIILNKFPSIYKVKCINHTNSCSEIAPGNVTVIPISNLRNQNAVDLLKPLTSVNTLYEIQEQLKKLSSPFINIEVFNPLYEEIMVKFTVYFYSGYDKGYYTQELNKEIIRFLSPWAYDEGSDIVFGGKIHASYILNFVEEREYVDYVTGFEMYQITDGIIPQDSVEVAAATTSRSIIVSSDQHKITYA